MKILDVPQSGSIAGQTSAHNRFGQYRRTRATPVNPNSSWQGTVRGRLAVNAAAWRALTSVQRSGWETLGLQMTRTDALGQSYTLTGFQAFVSVNNNLANAGDSLISDAPALTTPSAPETGVVTMTAATLSIAYTPTPLPAGERLFVYASGNKSAGREFEADLRFIGKSAAAAASPYDGFTAWQTRWGTPIVGNKVFFSLHRYKAGFLSGPLVTSKVVTA